MCCTFNPTGTLAAVGSTHAPYLLAWSLHDAHRRFAERGVSADRFAEARGQASTTPAQGVLCDGVLSSGQVRAEEELTSAGLEEGKYFLTYLPTYLLSTDYSSILALTLALALALALTLTPPLTPALTLPLTPALTPALTLSRHEQLA